MKSSHKSKASSDRIEAQNTPLDDSRKSKSGHQAVHHGMVSNDRLGPDEPLDEVNVGESTKSGISTGEAELLTPDHRVSKIEPDDEYNNENLIEEGLQGYMHDSLTKPRK